MLEVNEVQVAIINDVKQSFYSKEYKLLSEEKPLMNSKLTELNPVIDKSGSMTVGDRLKHTKTMYGTKQQVKLPTENHISELNLDRNAE